MGAPVKSSKGYIDEIEKHDAPKMVYIAGPYRKPDPCANTQHAMYIATVLLDTGLCVPILPHLTHFWHTTHPREPDVWLTYDAHMLARCDALYRLPGESAGADIEEDIARHLNMPIFSPGPNQYQNLLKWLRTGTLPE
jgi:hypothetical protein